MNWSEEKLNQILSKPSAGLIEDIQKIQGDICILGAGGKMGVSLALLAKEACRMAGIEKRIWAVSRFSNSQSQVLLEANGVETVSMDLLEAEAVKELPEVKNIVYMAGKKFGTNGKEWETWRMNVEIPTLVARKFKDSNIVVFSSGNVYPQVPISSGGCSEKVKPIPIGEYAMSTLGRERVFEAASHSYGTKVLIYRLNYAVDLHYGVLNDLAQKIINKENIDLSAGNFNCVWQGYANEVAIRSLLHASSPAKVLNVTGPETVSVRYAAERLGHYLDIAPIFSGTEGELAYLNNAAKCFELFGYPNVTLGEMIKWQAEWLLQGGRVLNAPTHFEEKGGNY